MPSGIPGVPTIWIRCKTCGKKFRVAKALHKRRGIKYCSKPCAYNSPDRNEKLRKAFKGKPLKKETLEKMRATRLRNSGWYHEPTLKEQIRSSIQMMEWRWRVFTRDKYVCRNCGGGNGKLCAHHIIPYAQIIKMLKILTMEDALKDSILWDIDNGITYCVDCHRDVHRNTRKRRNI
jgi:hypothetical protein